MLRKHQKGSSVWSRKESGRMGIAQKMQITRNPSACKVWHACSKRLHHKQRWLTEEQPRWASLPMENDWKQWQCFMQKSRDINIISQAGVYLGSILHHAIAWYGTTYSHLAFIHSNFSYIPHGSPHVCLSSHNIQWSANVINLCKQPGAVQDVLGHSRYLNKPGRCGTEACPSNFTSVPYRQMDIPIKSLTKPNSSFQHLDGWRSLRMWKPRFSSCPRLRKVKSKFSLLKTVLIASYGPTWMGISPLLCSRSSAIMYKNDRFLRTCGNE